MKDHRLINQTIEFSATKQRYIIKGVRGVEFTAKCIADPEQENSMFGFRPRMDRFDIDWLEDMLSRGMCEIV